MPQTQFSGRAINDGIPIPATLKTQVSNSDECIVGVVDGIYLKMVKLRVTGPNSYDWINTKYDDDYNKLCVTSFSESCFVGWNASESRFLILLEAEPKGNNLSSWLI